MRTLLRTVGAVVAMAISLSGCVQMTQTTTGKPVALQRDGSRIVAIVCTDLEISGLKMRDRVFPGDWQTFWEFDKTLTVRAGDELSPSMAAELGVAEGNEPEMTANHEIAIYFRADPASSTYYEDEFAAKFLVGESGLSETEWLHDDDSFSAEPCN